MYIMLLQLSRLVQNHHLRFDLGISLLLQTTADNTALIFHRTVRQCASYAVRTVARFGQLSELQKGPSCMCHGNHRATLRRPLPNEKVSSNFKRYTIWDDSDEP